MGIDVCASLIYGFVFEAKDQEELDTLTSELNKPFKPAQPEEKNDYQGSEWDEWRTTYHKWCVTGPGLEYGRVGHCDSTEKSWVGLIGHTIFTSWEEQLVSLEAMQQPKDDEIILLHKFAQKFGIKDYKIGWYLIPYFST